MVAFDADADLYGSVKYLITSTRPGAELFRLDADTGILYPRQSLQGLKGMCHAVWGGWGDNGVSGG